MNKKICFIMSIAVTLCLIQLVRKIIINMKESMNTLRRYQESFDYSAIGLSMVIQGTNNLIKELIKSEKNYTNMIILLLIILAGALIIYIFSKKIYILNFLKDRKTDITNSRKVRNMKIKGYEVNEIPLNVVRLFNEGKNMDETKSNLIVDEIKDQVEYYLKKIDGFSSAFTGMGPIPYTMLLGTYLEDVTIDKYLEYNSYKQDYYELSSKKDRYNFKKDMSLEKQEKDKNPSEIAITISLTHEVVDEDVKNFNDLNIYNIKVKDIKSNNIKYTKQLRDYSNYIIEEILNLKRSYPKLEKIHLLSSIPSCLSLELGKLIANRSNMLPYIISYQYNYNSNPRYEFGICINGDKGRYIKARSCLGG